jgi:hypothetical protein
MASARGTSDPVICQRPVNETPSGAPEKRHYGLDGSSEGANGHSRRNLTANLSTDDLVTCLKAGYDMYVYRTSALAVAFVSVETNASP